MAKNYLKQLSLLNEQFSSHVILRICFLIHLVYIPMIGLPILLQENMWTDPGNILIARRHTMWKLGLRPRKSFSGNT
jgi:hypothetical protein